MSDLHTLLKQQTGYGRFDQHKLLNAKLSLGDMIKIKGILTQQMAFLADALLSTEYDADLKHNMKQYISDTKPVRKKLRQVVKNQSMVPKSKRLTIARAFERIVDIYRYGTPIREIHVR